MCPKAVTLSHVCLWQVRIVKIMRIIRVFRRLKAANRIITALLAGIVPVITAFTRSVGDISVTHACDDSAYACTRTRQRVQWEENATLVVLFAVMLVQESVDCVSLHCGR